MIIIKSKLRLEIMLKQKQTIEQIYQKKTQLEHILLRPDTYIGSVEYDRQLLWVYDQAN